VSDVATVVMGTEDHVALVAGDGKPAALVNISRQVGGNTEQPFDARKDNQSARSRLTISGRRLLVQDHDPGLYERRMDVRHRAGMGEFRASINEQPEAGRAYLGRLRSADDGLNFVEKLLRHDRQHNDAITTGLSGGVIVTSQDGCRD